MNVFNLFSKITLDKNEYEANLKSASSLTKEEVEMNAQNLYDTMQQIRADFEQKKNKKKARNKNGEKESKWSK